MKRRLLAMVALVAVLAMVGAACSNDDDGGGDTTGDHRDHRRHRHASPSGCPGTTTKKSAGRSGTSPRSRTALEAGGAEYISTDAGSSAEQQITDVENLISQGADAIIILAQDSEAILPAVQSAADQGIPVIAYDRLIEDPSALYITFDNVEVGRMQAEAVLAQVPKGNYVYIKGNSADANADFLRSGQQEVLQDAEDAGDIKNVGETYTDNWDPALAQTEMEQFLTENNNDVQAVVAENDGMAGGVVAALEAQGLAGQVAVSGQDGDAAALNRVALGTQTVDVWKDARELGKAAGEAAVALANGAALADVRAPSRSIPPAGTR